MSTPDSSKKNGPPPPSSHPAGNTAVSPAGPYSYAYPPHARHKPEPTGLAAYQPTTGQTERADQWRRFTRLYVIWPLSLLSGVVLILSIFLLYLAIWPLTEQTRPFLSAVADILVIIFLLVVTFFLALILAAICGAGIAYRQYWRKQPDSPLKKYGYTRILLWQIDNLAGKPAPYINKFSQKIAGFVIKINALLAYVETRLARLTRAPQKSNPAVKNDADGENASPPA